MEVFGAFSAIVILFPLIGAVLAFLMPFFVFRIRNEIISINKKMSMLLQILSGEEHIELNDLGRKIKRCPSCGCQNRYEDSSCVNCGNPLP